jgi:hypothetical protein
MKIGFVTGLQLLLIGLKLAGVITASWWLVVLPFLLCSIAAVGFFIFWIGCLVMLNRKF